MPVLGIGTFRLSQQQAENSVYWALKDGTRSKSGQTPVNDPVISGIAKVHGKTSAQVILRWHVQAGNIAIPGSNNEQHIIENAHIWDFSLTAAEMDSIAMMEKNRRNSTY